MADTRQNDGLMRFAQRLADAAAVAKSRYDRRLHETPTGPAVGNQAATESPSPAAASVIPTAPPVEARSEAPKASVSSNQPRGSAMAAEDGSAGHDSSREKIGDQAAMPAPSRPTSLPEPCRDHVVPHGAWPTVKELFRRFGSDECPAYAAALSYFGILAIFPMLVVAVAALAYLFQDPHEAMLRLQRLVSSILPGGTAERTARDVLRQANVEKSVETLIQTRGIAGLVGLLSLIWASLQIFVSAAPAANAAFEVKETRSWLMLRLLALGLLIGAGALFLLSLLPTSGPDFVRNLHIPWLGLPERVPWYVDLLFALVALGINVTMFALIYRFLPNAPTTWREAFAGGLVAGVLWEVAKRAFAYYLANFAHYDKVYGTLGGLIILVLWIYYTAMILLLGAETAALSQDLRLAADASEGQPAPERGAPAPTQRRARA